MAKQLIFKAKYVQGLKEGVASGRALEFYKSNEFVYDKAQTLMLRNIESPDGLSDRLDVNDDCNTAIMLYEAFKSLEPVQASDDRFWVYLSHVDLYSYMVKRWDGVYKGSAKDGQKYILDHWFLLSSAQGSLMRHALAGLWWSVYLSIDENRGEGKYDLTRILFRALDVPTRTLGTYKLGRHKEAVIGILEFIQENEDLFRSRFGDKTRMMTKHLNFIGGVKPISYYDRHFFKSELLKIAGAISRL
ncbi:MAG TPA: DUF6339 family protein [Flavobacterium sp.]|nr:DUF6339 family protein [Flavobacterium sp.]